MAKLGWLLALATASTPAWARSVSIQFMGGAGTTPTAEAREHWFNRARCRCGMEAAFRVALTEPADADQAIEVCLVDGEDCKPLATIDDAHAPDLATGRIVSVPVQAIMGADCAEAEVNSTIVAVIVDGSAERTNSSITMPIDSSPPPAPTVAEAHGGDHALDVMLASPDGGVTDPKLRYQVLCALSDTRAPIYARPAEAGFITEGTLCPSPGAPAGGDELGLDPTFDCGPTVLATSGTLHVDLSGSSVRNGQALDLRVVALDAAGNSAVSDLQEHVVLVGPTGFGDVYHDAGGTAQGGCQSAPGRSGAAAILFTLCALARARRRASALAAIWLLVASARADDLDAATPPPPKRTLDWSVQLSVGAYRPDIDSELYGGHGPYERVFGGARPLFRASVTRYLRVPGGAPGLDLGAGFMTAGAADCLIDETSARPDCTMRSSTASTRLSLVPASLSLVYRYTALADRLHVPLVPRAGVGLDATRWWESGGDVTDSGVTFGWHVSAGVGLRLDWLDPTAAGSLLSGYGIGHTELFVEYARLVETGFGAAHKLDLSDGVISGGIGFSF